MANSPWLWLNEAADLIAGRLLEAEPQKFVNSAAALADARNELLDQAYRGALEVQGKSYRIEEHPQFMLREWAVLSSEYWNPQYSSANSVANITMDWDHNYLAYEDVEIELCGHDQLRVRSEDIERLWLMTTNDVDSDQSQKFPPPPTVRHAGGAPRKFRDDLLIEMIRLANTPDGLPEDKSELVRQLKKFTAPHWDPDEFPSDSSIYTLVNLVYGRVFAKT
jgi:hypothetical protein